MSHSSSSKRPFEATLDGTCDPADIVRPGLGPPSWRAGPSGVGDEAASSAANVPSNYCCTYDQTQSGTEHYGFYLATKSEGYNKIGLALSGDFDKDTGVLGISIVKLFPVKDESDVTRWDKKKRDDISQSIDANFQSLQETNRLTSCLANQVAKDAVSNGDVHTLMRSMNTLCKETKLDTARGGTYALKFYEGNLNPTQINPSQAYDMTGLIRPTTSSKSLNLTAKHRDLMMKAVSKDTFTPPISVPRLVWGNVELWNQE